MKPIINKVEKPKETWSEVFQFIEDTIDFGTEKKNIRKFPLTKSIELILKQYYNPPTRR